MSAAEFLELTDPATFVRHDPRDYWDRIRPAHPIHWHDSPGDLPGFWVVTGFADVQAAYGNAKQLSSARGTVLDVLLHGNDSASGKMLAVTDRPRHQKLRTLMLRAFSPRVLGPVVERVQEQAATLVAGVVELGSFDFATEVAEHIPMTTICDLLSIPDGDRADLLAWNKLALSADSEEADELDSLIARNDIVAYFMDLAKYRRDNPGDDVITMIATAEIDGVPLTDEEIALNCYSLILGGDESSRMSAIGAVKALSENPAQWAALRSGEVSLDSAVEEVLRWVTPAMHFARTALVDLEIAGQQVRAGDIVTLWNTSANDDPAVFDDPRRFDLSRDHNKHLTFGHGPHFCVGAFLGRAELRALLAALVTSVREIELDGVPPRIYSNFLFGYSSLPTVFR
ncbi:cytochrome P450 [Kribbella sandramycini]|uniref:Cytochrome P450 n=1 Tax=Kribbella sandramycini TaxID=60450 RepID=A0A7Y4KXI5_9ACTN|nr:cytochrome P450 [Kribbella sandramycini]MBB6569691.1 cytochrome P450 [Kribbella sandramycini]NOL40478.1 cytochrome P450 [Kribbella sandramycini]